MSGLGSGLGSGFTFKLSVSTTAAGAGGAAVWLCLLQALVFEGSPNALHIST